MEELQGHLIDIAMTLLGSALIGLIGFVWKISHRTSALERRLDGLLEVQKKDEASLRRDIDMIMEKVDKHGEWTTNRMMSIVKEVDWNKK